MTTLQEILKGRKTNLEDQLRDIEKSISKCDRPDLYNCLNDSRENLKAKIKEIEGFLKKGR